MGSDGRDLASFYEAEREPMARRLLVIGGDAEAACDAVAEAFIVTGTATTIDHLPEHVQTIAAA